jgi:hypothetical protein
MTPYGEFYRLQFSNNVTKELCMLKLVFCMYLVGLILVSANMVSQGLYKIIVRLKCVVVVGNAIDTKWLVGTR